MKSKYHARKCVLDNITFDSRKEANRYLELKLMERTGAIKELRCQVPYTLVPSQRDPNTGKVIEREIRYIADFVYKENGEEVVEDVKGFRTDEYKIKRKLMLWVHGIRIKEV